MALQIVSDLIFYCFYLFIFASFTLKQHDKGRKAFFALQPFCCPICPDAVQKNYFAGSFYNKIYNIDFIEFEGVV